LPAGKAGANMAFLSQLSIVKKELANLLTGLFLLMRNYRQSAIDYGLINSIFATNLKGG